ncbi:chromate transporter [Erysipelothrix rhusiopathiae]|nr:chromate transporter [Erysipelothrix rhusiopathiae]MDE8203733.1 chromate transporter [Erysipelothrix rhusiopathiae]MDE8301106.1 chromate transporter [Erysipelothrix rhusiopathiae]MDE8306195.1 chromate transporter [Erysipelothrix rhusiopathiae]
MLQLIKLFFEFLYVGLFSLGGGYATIPLIGNRIINIHGWITTQDFINMITISQMTPGPLTVNISTFVGLKIAGIPGAMIATLGCVLIGVSLTLSVYGSYEKASHKDLWELILKSLRISSATLISLATVTIFSMLLLNESSFSVLTIVAFILVFAMSYKFKLQTTQILILSAFLGLLWLL